MMIIKDNHANAVFQHEGDEIRSFLNQFDNLYICNGDKHWQYVTHPGREQMIMTKNRTM